MYHVSHRLDAIAEDAELSDKSTTELQQLAELIKNECSQAVREYEEKLRQDDKFDGKKKGGKNPRQEINGRYLSDFSIPRFFFSLV